MPRTALMEQRHYDSADLDLPVVCPAGERITERAEGPACRCRIEDTVITAARDGSSLRIFCQGEHTLCPTWRAAREIEWENGAVEDLVAPTGVERTYTVEELEEMDERLRAGDNEGAARIGAEIVERRRAQGLLPSVE